MKRAIQPKIADAPRFLVLSQALARVPLTGEASAELDALCRPVMAADRHAAAFNPIHPDTTALFAAVLSGDFTVNGFRNRDLQGKLYPAAATDAADARRRTHRTSRLIAKLRGHGLITVPVHLPVRLKAG